MDLKCLSLLYNFAHLFAFPSISFEYLAGITKLMMTGRKGWRVRARSEFSASYFADN